MKQVFNDNIWCKHNRFTTRVITFDRVLTIDQFNLIADGLLHYRVNHIIYIKYYVLTEKNLTIACDDNLFEYIWIALGFLNIIKYID